MITNQCCRTLWLYLTKLTDRISFTAIFATPIRAGQAKINEGVGLNDGYQLSVITFIQRAQTSSLNAIGGATRQGASCPCGGGSSVS